MIRVDLFTLIHKGVRALLFDISTEAARIDLRSDIAVDGMLEQITRALGFLDEHAHHEDTHVLPVLRAVAPDLANSLGVDHRVLDAIQTEVECAAEKLAAAQPADRGPLGAQLVRLLNRLTAAHLTHMGREETEASSALWAALDDTELAAVRARLVGSIPTARYAEWMQMIAPALNPVERSLVVGAPVG